MNKFLSLTKVYLLGLVRTKEDKFIKKIGRVLILLLAGFILVLYSYKFASFSMKGYKVMNIEYILLPEFFAITSIFLMFSNFKKINGLFFKSNDYEMLCSMPIKRKYIVISKILEVYLTAFLISLVTMIPAYVVYINNVANLELIFHIMFFTSLIFIPCIPIVIAIFIGYLISYISTFFKNREGAQFFLTMGAFITGYLLMNKASSMGAGDFANFGKMLINFFDKFYPLTKTYKYIVMNYDILSLIIFIICNITVLVLLAFIITKTYDYIHEKMLHVKSSRVKKIKSLKYKSLTKTLLKKDYKKLFSSANYLINTNVGIVLIIGLFALFLFNGNITKVISSISSDGGFYALPLMFIMFLGFIYPASVSLSLDGKTFYILRTLPISFKNILKEKLLFELSLSIIPAILLSIVIFVKFKFGFLITIVFILIYLLSTVLYTLIHLLLDITFLKLDWVSELKLCKQSLQAFLSVICAFALGIAPMSLIKNDVRLVIYLCLIILLIIAAYIALVTFGEKKYEKTCN